MATETFEIGTETVEGRELWTADFSDESGYRLEFQENAGSYEFNGDTLRVDTTEEQVGATVWYEETFPEDFILNYRASFEEGERSTSRNFNCFFNASASPDSDTLEDTELSGGYGDYHDIPNYIFTLTSTHCRLRRDPGFNLEDELLLGVSGDHQDHFYDVTVVKHAGEITTVVDGSVIHRWEDPDPLGPGWIGMRTYDTNVTYDHWAVYEPV
jgi:hypothetical protein